MGVVNLVIVIITAGVAVIACVFAGLTFRSQLRSEKLQEQTNAIQEEATRIQQETYDSQKRATEIQDRMDARDLEFRRLRAEAALSHLLHIIFSVANRASLKDSVSAYDDIVALMNGWQEDLMYLPECEIRKQAGDVFERFIVPGGGYSQNHHMKSITSRLQQLRSNLLFDGLERDCREAIKNMR